MRSLEYRDQIIEMLVEKVDMNHEDARELCDKHSAILEEGIEKNYLPRWAVERILEAEG